MKRVFQILLVLFVNVFSATAQEKKPNVHLEVTNSNNVKKEFDAKCFVMNFVVSNRNFAVILFEKGLIADANEIKVFLNQQQKTEPVVITIAITDQNVVQSAKLAGIPYSVIRQQTQELSVIQPTFFPENVIPIAMKKTTETEISDFKLEMEKWINN